MKNKSNWLYCYNYSQQDIWALCTRPEDVVLLPIDCVWNEGFWILQTPVPRCIIFWWGTAESYRVMLLLVHTCLLVGTQKILKTFSWIHLCDEIPLSIRLCSLFFHKLLQCYKCYSVTNVFDGAEFLGQKSNYLPIIFEGKLSRAWHTWLF